MNVICFGDSLTSCGGLNSRYSDILQDRFPRHKIINKGIGGETFVDAILRLEADVLSLKPDLVIIEFGANDWWQDERPKEDWARDLETIITALKEIGAQAIVSGVFGLYENEAGELVEKEYGSNERAREYREMEKALAEKYDCPYISNIQEKIVASKNCWSDMNHPNEMGNRYVADKYQEALETFLGPAEKIRPSGISTTRDFWMEAVAMRPQHCAVVDGDIRQTYAEANAIIEHYAAGFVELSPCPKVAVYLPNGIDYFHIYWAIVRLGGAIIPLNTWLKKDNLEHIFNTVKPDFLICASAKDTDVIASANCPAYMQKESDGALSLTSLRSENEAPFNPIDKDADAIIMHTSGTTGAPKGAVMRHSDLIFNVICTINAHQFNEDDRHLLINPMFHCTALYSSLPTAAYQKSTCVIASDTQAESLLALCEKEKVSTFLSIPTIFQRIVSVEDTSKFNLSSLRLMAYAGSQMPVSTVRLLHEKFPEVDLHNFFGLTETTSMTHVLNGEEAEQRPDSIGRLLPFVEAIIADGDLQPVSAGTIGQLLFSRFNVIPGYYNDPEKLPQAFVEVNGQTWFDTGDLALIDDEGYFFIKGRAKDMIIVGGENVYASEVEAVLMAHDNVEEAAIIGIEATGVRQSLGEMIQAFIVLRDPDADTNDIRRHCHKKLASYKIPHVYEFIDALPRNPSGKVVKDELRNI
ncbi:MAG: AMP-binding protein [Lentisphaeria bacterium]|nr:AMP-binding protein [Lentisphaeria bacterium]